MCYWKEEPGKLELARIKYFVLKQIKRFSIPNYSFLVAQNITDLTIYVIGNTATLRFPEVSKNELFRRYTPKFGKN